MAMWGRLSVRMGLCRGERSSKMDSSIEVGSNWDEVCRHCWTSKLVLIIVTFSKQRENFLMMILHICKKDKALFAIRYSLFHPLAISLHHQTRAVVGMNQRGPRSIY